MKNICKLPAVTCLVILCNYCIAQSHKTAGRKIDSLFASYNSSTPGVAVAVVKEGKIVFKKGYGMANLEHDLPVTPQTVFNIASVSKQFTAFAIYLLVNDGMLTLEEDVRKYVPELPVYEKPIRIKHLLGHTSGLKDAGALQSIAGGYVNADLVTTEQNLKVLSKQKELNFQPGSAFGYSNSNYTILAAIVHRVSGKSFSAFAQERIFNPLGMHSTRVADNHEAIIKHKAESYELQNGKYYQKSLIESHPGPSNLWTTVEDLAKWALNFEKPIVGNAELIKAFNEPSYLDNGKKVVLRVLNGDTIFVAKGQNRSKDKGNYIGYGGHTAGFRTFLGRYPDHHLAIIQLSNDELNESLGGRWDIADYYIPHQPVAVKPAVAAVPADVPVAAASVNYKTDLTEFTGSYYNDELETGYHIEVKDNKLLMKHKRLYDITLERTGENKFSGTGPYTFSFDIIFLQNEAGAVTGFNMSNWGAKNIRFKKKG